jgi:hypothetical protein
MTKRRFSKEPLPKRDADDMGRRLLIRCPVCGCCHAPIVPHTATIEAGGVQWTHACQSCDNEFRALHPQPKAPNEP